MSFGYTDLLKALQLADEDVVCVYQYGSRFVHSTTGFSPTSVYGTSHEGSDWDFTIVVTNETTTITQRFVEGDLDANIYTVDQFIALLAKGTELPVIENIFLPDSACWKRQMDFTGYYKNDLTLLRTAVSGIAHKGFAYAKILFTKENDVIKGKKNLIHSIRNTMFGIQLATSGKITDYSCAKHHYEEIMTDTSTAWDHYKQIYGALGLEYHHKFESLLPPKEHTERSKERKKDWRARSKQKRKEAQTLEREKRAQENPNYKLKQDESLPKESLIDESTL